MKFKDYQEEKKEIVFEIACSKGTYIRTVCEEVAQRLHTIGNMKELERVMVGEFHLKEAVTVEELRKKAHEQGWLHQHIITMETLLKNNPNLKLEDFKLRLFLNGVVLSVKKPDGIFKIYDEKGTFIGTGTVVSNQLKRDIIVSDN